MVNKLVCVLPFHKEVLSINEIISFERILRIVKNHDIVIIFPKKRNLPIEFQKSSVKVILLDEFWFSSLENYNKLKISSFFYKIFEKYDFLLTYELDAYIFENRLDYFMNLNLDYIGAPWLDDLKMQNENKIVFNGVGNSGFSLRKVRSCIFILKNREIDIYLKKYVDFNFYFFGLKRSMPNFFHIKKCIYRLFHWENLDYYSACLSINEDIFWSYMFEKYGLKIPSPLDAMKFSFECYPTELFEINKNTLPMGCHAWEKWDFEFWKNHIDEVQ